MIFLAPKFFKLASIPLLLCAALPLNAKQPPVQQTISDLAYGTSLYHFFQDKNLRAITDINVAKQRQTLINQPDEADLLLSGLYFDYGLAEESSEILTRLLGEETADEIKNRVWFNLGRVQYEQNNMQQAEELLSRITENFSEQRNAQKNYILSNIQVQNQQFEQAAKTTSKIEDDSIWSAYARYNLAVSLSTSPQPQQAQQWLAKLISMPTQDDELSSLQDSARLLSGLTALKQKQPDQTIKQLQGIHTSSPLSNKALLATGWAWSQLTDHQKALNYWLTLTDRQQTDGATQEAYLAIAYAYEQLDNKAGAIQYYEQALQQFENTLQDMSQSIDSINQMDLINGLYRDGIIQPGLQQTFQHKLPQHQATPYLHKMFASKKFQQAISHYQQLLEIHNSLLRWKNNLPALEIMLSERIKTFEAKRELVNQTTDFTQLEQLQQQRDELAQQVLDIKQSQDFYALASEDETDYLEQLEELDSLFSRLEGTQDLTEEKQKARLMSGLLLWDLSTDFPPRYWRLFHQLQLLDRALQQAKESALSLQQASTTNDSKLIDFNQRIKGQSDEILRMENNTSQLIDQQEQLINSLAIKVIENQQFHLNQLKLSARYSLTRLYDELSESGKMQ